MTKRFNIYSGLLKTYVDEKGQKHLSTTASSTIKDLAGDDIQPVAIEQMAEAAKDNLTIFLNHEYRVPEDVLGSVTDTRMQTRGVDSDGNPIVDLDFDVRLNESNPRALQTYAAIESGTKLGTSIGAIVRHATKKKGGGLSIDDIQLLEASIVGIPANPRSWVHYAMKSLDLGNIEDLPVIDETGEPDEEPELKEADVIEPQPELPVDEKAANTDTTDKDAEPEVTEADPDKEAARTRVTVTVDSDAQDAGKPASTPDQAMTEEERGDAGTEPADALGDSVTRSMTFDREDVIALVKRVDTLLTELNDLRKNYNDLKAESDEDKENLAVAKQIIDRIADLPVGRKTHFVEAVEDYRKRFPQYDNEFIKLLEK